VRDFEDFDENSYNQQVYEIAKTLASSIGVHDFNMNLLDKLSQIITDAAGDKVAYERVYQANLRFAKKVDQLKDRIKHLENMCNICRAIEG